MSGAAKRMKANLKLEGRPCLWCAQPFVLGDPVASCTQCASEQHAACWDQKGGCGTTGCVYAPLKRLDAVKPIAAAQPAPHRPSQIPYQQQRSAADRPPPSPGFKYCTACGNQVTTDAQIC